MAGMGSDLLLVIVVGTALAFDFTNGFHDTANAMATSIATGALPPRVAVALSAVLNVAGAFLSLAVAMTIAKGVVDPSAITLNIIFAGLIGAITWNLITWYFGLPSSSSHALIGGVVGATLVIKGADAVKGAGIVEKVLIPAVLAPFLAGDVALVGTYLAFRLTRREKSDHVRRGFRVGQIASASMLSLAHGTNDAQKTMGVITLALIAHGSLDANASVPTWVIVSCRAGDRRRHLHGRMAGDPDDGHAHHRDRAAPGLRGRRVLGSGDPGLVPLRPPALDDAGRRRQHHRLRGRPELRRGALERRGPPGDRLADHAAGRRARRRRHGLGRRGHRRHGRSGRHGPGGHRPRERPVRGDAPGPRDGRQRDRSAVGRA